MKDNIFIRVVAYFFIPFMCIAMFMSLAGVRGPIQLDDTFMSLLRKATFVSNEWNLQIPNIPQIPLLNNYGVWYDILRFLTTVANAFVNVCNWAINFMNFIISIFTFIAGIIKTLWDYRNFDYTTTGPLTWWL